MDKDATKDIGEDELDSVVGGAALTPKTAETAKKTPDVVEHREGGAH